MAQSRNLVLISLEIPVYQLHSHDVTHVIAKLFITCHSGTPGGCRRPLLCVVSTAMNFLLRHFWNDAKLLLHLRYYNIKELRNLALADAAAQVERSLR